MTAQHSLADFYAGSGRDDRGRSLHQIQTWSDGELERVHNYMQWLFPLTERSAFNPCAPILDAKTIGEFRKQSGLRAHLEISFVRMLAFFGFELVNENPLRVVPSKLFAEQAENWLRPSNHNYRRITRIIKSLRLLGLDDQALAFFRCLARLYDKETETAEPRISRETFAFWKAAAV